MWFIIFFILCIIFAPYIGRALTWLIAKLFQHQLEKQTRAMEDNFARAAGLDPEEVRKQRKQKEAQRKQEEKTRREGGWSAPAPKPKKFDKTTGEYVKFKEVTVDEKTEVSGSTSDGSHFTATEEQITDVKWEEIS